MPTNSKVGRPKGQPKTGGRVKGTPNKTTQSMRTIIADLLTEYHESGQMTADFKDLEPKDRLMVAEKLMNYTTPKQQSTTIDMTEGGLQITLESRLKELSQNYVPTDETN